MSEVNKLVKEMSEYGFHIGRVISHSKSIYRQSNPNNLIVYNAVIKMFASQDSSAVTYIPYPMEWSGDLDISKDIKSLYEIALKLKNDLYIYYEMGETPLLIIKGSN